MKKIGLYTLLLLTAFISSCKDEDKKDNNANQPNNETPVFIAVSGNQISLTGPYVTTCLVDGNNSYVETISFDKDNYSYKKSLYTGVTDCSNTATENTVTATVTTGVDANISSWVDSSNTTTAAPGSLNDNAVPLSDTEAYTPFTLTYTQSNSNLGISSGDVVADNFFIIDDTATANIGLYRKGNTSTTASIANPFAASAFNNRPTADHFIINEIIYEESGTDPKIHSAYDAPTPGTAIVLDRDWDGSVYLKRTLFFLPGAPSTGTFSSSNAQVVITHQNDAGTSYQAVADPVSTVTVSTAGDVGGTVAGTFALNLCLATDVSGSTCAGSTISLSGQFSTTREANIGDAIPSFTTVSANSVTLDGPFITTCIVSGSNSYKETVSFSGADYTYSKASYAGVTDCSNTASTDSVTATISAGTDSNITGWVDSSNSTATAPDSLNNPNVALSDTEAYTPFTLTYTQSNSNLGITSGDVVANNYFIIDDSSTANTALYRKGGTTDTASIDYPFAVIAIDPPSAVDNFVIGSTTYTETGNDPYVHAEYDTATPGTAIVLDRDWNGSMHLKRTLLFLPNAPSTGTFESSSSLVYLSHVDDSGNSHVAVASPVSTVVVSVAGAVGETIEGTFDLNLCPAASVSGSTCTVSTTNYTGSFRATREADL